MELSDEYFDEEQLAQYLCVTARTVRHWRALDEAPPVTKIGSRTYYKKTSVRSWLESREQEEA
jgi:hypothetical protein